MTLSRDIPSAERIIKQMVLQIWEHYSLAQSGVATLTELGYSMADGAIPAFWVDVFTEAHRMVIDAKKEAAK